MKQEDKTLLLKDLCARLPYELKVKITNIKSFNHISYDAKLYKINLDYIVGVITNDGIKYLQEELIRIRPYLFPLSSMTEEQKEELENLGWYFDNFEIHNVNECFGTYREYVAHSDCFELIDWFNKNHFDYRGLIPKGLAIDATGLNIY